MTRSIKNFAVSFEDWEKEMIDKFFGDNKEYVRAAIIRILLIDWVTKKLEDQEA